MTRIVVLDDCDLDDGHLTRLRAVGEVEIHRGTPRDEEEAERRLKGAHVAVLGWTHLSGELLGRLPDLKLVSVWATGYDYVDTSAAGRLGVTVTNVPAYAGTAVSELALGLMLALCRKIPHATRRVRGGDLTWRGLQGVELSGRTLGVVGVGDIGGQVARCGRALGMRVLAHARTPSATRAEELGVVFRSLPELLAASDIVSLHVPLTTGTTGMIGADELAAMKAGSFLVNTARAGLVDQDALLDALLHGPLAGAALDDLDPARDDIAGLDNVVATPHIGFFTDAALGRKGDVCVSNVEAFLTGRPQNVVVPA